MNEPPDERSVDELTRRNAAMVRLVSVVQALSHARSLNDIMAIVRSAARELTGADGATFVLRDGDLCFYADEDAIGPLWKGQRFPMSACISGWVMLNGRSAAIPDIYEDDRIPVDAYRPTFVKSLAMVPIRAASPIGAIGNYWAESRRVEKFNLELLEALANTTSVAIENVQLYEDLEKRVAQRTRELKLANQELEAFSYSVSHDLRAPLRGIQGFADALLTGGEAELSPQTKSYLTRIVQSAERMNALIEDLLKLSRVTRAEMQKQPVDLARLATDIARRMTAESEGRRVEWQIPDSLAVHGDAGLLRIALDNLLANAWKYSSRAATSRITLGAVADESGETNYFVRDNGAGFDTRYADKLFGAFQRLHTPEEFPGSGIGLTIVQRIIHRHGGRIWAESILGEGATFWFTLPQDAPEA